MDDAREELLLDMAARLIKIRSVRSARSRACRTARAAEALAEGLRICREAGFFVKNYDNYVGTAM